LIVFLTHIVVVVIVFLFSIIQGFCT